MRSVEQTNALPGTGINQSGERESYVRPGVSFVQKVRALIQLTKPRIILLFALTGLTAMIVEGTLLTHPLQMWMVCLGIALTGGSANAFNQYLDRDIDSVMERTRQKRPLPNGSLSPNAALLFASVTGALATFILYAFGGALAAGLGVATIFYYVVIYTMWLKRTTPYNIVIGGAAGASAPLIGWAAATGHISFDALVMFLIIFMWTPPHFWALSLCLKDEYAKASVPMLPVVAGVEETKQQIFLYTLALIPLTLVPFITGAVGTFYFLSAVILGGIFIKLSWGVLKANAEQLRSRSWRTFGFSILYLLVLFLFMIADALITPRAHAAEKLPRELEGIGIEEKFGAQVDLNLTFKNEKGEIVPLKSIVNGSKPVMLLLAYYGCPNLCNFFLNGVTDGLKELQYQAGKEFEVVTVSIDPREDSELASAKKTSHIEALGKPDAAAGWHFWVNNEERTNPHAVDTNAKTLAEQVGFKYRWDDQSDQYAHTAAIVMLTPDGKVSRYLYGIQFAARDLRFGLLEAGGRKIGTIVDRMILFCYHYDPASKSYSLYARNVMRAGGGLTVLILAGILGTVIRRSHRPTTRRNA